MAVAEPRHFARAASLCNLSQPAVSQARRLSHDGLVIIALWSPWIAEAIFVAVALIWLAPDRRVEHVLPQPTGRSSG